jgi:hypothetical protein
MNTQKAMASPKIELVPKAPDVFQKELLRTQFAKRIFYLKNGEVIKQIWRISQLQPSSNLFFNIKTNATFRAKKTTPGIEKVHLEILEKGDVAQWLMQINA